LTEGNFGVSDVVSFIPEIELLEFASAVEVNSEHIIAKAIVDYANEKKIMIPKISEFKAIPGKGAQGKVKGRAVIMGSPSLLEELEIKITDERITELQKQGKTVIFAILDGKLVGAFALSDKIREVSKEAVRKLTENGIKVFMLTGDAEEVAAWVSKELGIDDYFAEVLPDQKAEKIKLLKKNVKETSRARKFR